MAKKSKSELAALSEVEGVGFGHDPGDEHHAPPDTAPAPGTAPAPAPGTVPAPETARTPETAPAPETAPELFDPDALAAKPVEAFGSAAEISVELARLGDPWQRFKAGYIEPLNQARADREAALLDWDRRIANLDEAHRKGRDVVQDELERKRLLENRLAAMKG